MTEKRPERRGYPATYEKLIPIVLSLIVIAIVVVLLVAAAVALGLVPAK